MAKLKLQKPAKLLSFSLPVSPSRVQLLSSSLPVSPSRVLRAPGTSLYHLVPRHLRTTWSKPEQSHLLPEACSPNVTDNRRQRQRQTERPPPNPSKILKRFHALYDDKLRYYMKKVSKLYSVFNPYMPSVLYKGRQISAEIAKISVINGLIVPSLYLNKLILIIILCSMAYE